MILCFPEHCSKITGLPAMILPPLRCALPAVSLNYPADQWPVGQLIQVFRLRSNRFPQMGLVTTIPRHRKPSKKYLSPGKTDNRQYDAGIVCVCVCVYWSGQDSDHGLIEVTDRTTLQHSVITIHADQGMGRGGGQSVGLQSTITAGMAQR